MKSDAELSIVAAKRSPLGAFQGSLSGAQSPDLAAAAIRACIDESGVDAADINEVLMGCVLPAGTRPGAGATGGNQSRPAAQRRVHDT